MDIQQILVADGVLPDTPELNKFFLMVQEADLCKHRAKRAVVKKRVDGIHVTLFIKSEAEALLESSLSTGVLAPWKNNFKIKVVT